MADREPVVCLGCALVCDDVTIATVPGEVPRLEPECGLGEAWLRAHVGRHGPLAGPVATVEDEGASLDAALSRTARALRDAARPLVSGAPATVEDARAAVALADRLGALVVAGPAGGADGAAGGVDGAAGAVALRGDSTATLGEIRDRTEVLVVWREDPMSSHPRLLDRLGRGGAPSARTGGPPTLVVVDDRDTETARRADVRLDLGADGDLEALSALLAGARDRGDVPDELGELLGRLRASAHCTIVHGPGLLGAGGRAGQRRLLALHALVRALCDGRRAVTLGLATSAGATGANDVLTWQTGYPSAVDLSAGHPEPLLSPLADEAVDVVLTLDGATVPGARTLAVSPEAVPGAEVWICSAVPGLTGAGTVHRLDGVPLSVEAVVATGRPSAASVLERLAAEVAR